MEQKFSFRGIQKYTDICLQTASRMRFLGVKKGAVQMFFSHNKHKHVCWKICKVRKETVHWNVWTNIKTLKFQIWHFESFIFWSLLWTALGRFSQCCFFYFSSSANHRCQHFYSAPSPPRTIKNLPTALIQINFVK